MDKVYIYIIAAVVIAAVIWFLFAKVLKNKKIDTKKSIPVDVQQIMDAVGGRENIRDTSSTNSKITFYLNDSQKVQTDRLKELGASGIVSTSEKTSVILGSSSKQIEEIIKDNLS